MMKTRIRLIFLGLICSVSLFAQKPSAYVLDQGDIFRVTSVVNQTMEQDVMGQSNEIKQLITTVDEYEVVEASATGYKLKSTAIQRVFEMTTADGEIKVNSDEAGDEHLAMRVLTGRVYFIEMNIWGKVLKVEGLDSLRSKITKELEGTYLSGQEDQILDALTEEQISSAFEQQFNIYPELGESEWKKTTNTVINGLPITINTDFSWDTDDTIFGAGQMTLEGDVEIQGMAMTANLSGTQNTIFDLDKATGLCTLIQTEQDLKGELNVQGVDIPMTIKTELKVTFKR